MFYCFDFSAYIRFFVKHLIEMNVNMLKQQLNFLGLVVQSIVSLTSWLRGQLVECFTTLLPNTHIFFVEKMREAFAFSHFFNKKYNWHISDINV